MKFTSSCMECIKKNGLTNYDFLEVEFNDDGIYNTKCSRGHETTLIIQDEKFEILFDLGTLALIDGYTREAVVNIASSYERFHEFCIRVILDKNCVDSAGVEKVWKQVKNSSERQLGAFYFIYLSEFKQEPPIFEQRYTSFRNNVIHKGYIPKYTEVYDYNKYVFHYIQQVLVTLKPDYRENILNLIANRLANANAVGQHNDEDKPVLVSMQSRMIYLLQDHLEINEDTFDKKYENLKDFRF